MSRAVSARAARGLAGLLIPALFVLPLMAALGNGLADALDAAT